MSLSHVRLIALVLALALVSGACGETDTPGAGQGANAQESGATPDAEERSRPDDAPPPIVLRTTGGQEQLGGLGTYCWSQVCADMIGTQIPDQPITVKTGEAIVLDFSRLGKGAPGEITCTVYRYDEAVKPVAGSNEPLIMPERGPDGDALDVDWCERGAIQPGETVQLPLDLEPGHYAIEVFASYSPNGGDTVQGFNVIVG